jgi:hypothetical protein
MSLGAVLGLPADPVRRPCLTGWRAQTSAASRATVQGTPTSRSYCSRRCTTNERAPAAGVQPPHARTGECGPLSWRPDRRAFGHRRPTRTEPALTRPTRGGSVARKCHSRALAMVSNATSGRHLHTPELPLGAPAFCAARLAREVRSVRPICTPPRASCDGPDARSVRSGRIWRNAVLSQRSVVIVVAPIAGPSVRERTHLVAASARQARRSTHIMTRRGRPSDLSEPSIANATEPTCAR